MDAAALRAAFPVFGRRAYLNAGTCGPLATAAVRAATDAFQQAATEGRTGAYSLATMQQRERLRGAYAGVLGADPGDVALTTCTSEGIVRILGALKLAPGDEVLTSTEEHSGLLGPLAAARDQRGLQIRAVAFDQLADAVSPATRLVACSHVSWVNGRLAPDLAGCGVPVLLDGAQGVGAIPIDLAALGCAFYAGSGQKWLCGPVGTGMLWVSPEYSERIPATGPTYINLADPASGLDAVAHAGAARLDASALSLETLSAASAALEVLADAGWEAIYERSAALAATLADALAARGLQVAPRDHTTLVAWHDPDPPATRDRLAAADVVIRDLPATGLLRASVGAWNDESDVERLLAAL